LYSAPCETYKGSSVETNSTPVGAMPCIARFA
jgi:hypothetical protein